MPRQTLRLSAKRPAKPNILGEKTDGNPMVGSFSNRNSSRPDMASASISFSETKSRTSCPRERRTSATASPGNKWPPVPPHAITVFIGFSKPQSKIENRKSKIPSHSRRRPRADHSALFLRGLEDALTVNVQQNSHAIQARGQVR